jgi:hypothetical protein
MTESQARGLGADLSISPALLTFMPREESDLLTAFKTNTGTGVMIEEVFGPPRCGPDRIACMRCPRTAGRPRRTRASQS